MTTIQHARLLNALTEYDRKQSSKRFYNHYALGHYCAALQSAEELIDGGMTLRASLVRSFNGRLLDALLRSVGEQKSSREEQRA